MTNSADREYGLRLTGLRFFTEALTIRPEKWLEVYDVAIGMWGHDAYYIEQLTPLHTYLCFESLGALHKEEKLEGGVFMLRAAEALFSSKRARTKELKDMAACFYAAILNRPWAVSARDVLARRPLDDSASTLHRRYRDALNAL